MFDDEPIPVGTNDELASAIAETFYNDDGSGTHPVFDAWTSCEKTFGTIRYKSPTDCIAGLFQHTIRYVIDSLGITPEVFEAMDGKPLSELVKRLEERESKLSLIFDEMTRQLSYPSYPAEVVLRVFNEKLDRDCDAVAEEVVRNFLAKRGQDLNQLMSEGE